MGSAKVAKAVPEIIHRIFIYGQVLKHLPFNKEVFEALEMSEMPEKYRDRLSGMKESSTHNAEDIKVLFKWINKYTEGYYSKKGGKPPFGPIMRGMISSPDYTMKDFKAIVVNGYTKNESLLIELAKVDLSETLKEVDIPYLILQGDTDIVTSTKMISDFVKTSKNNNLHMELVENSGHIPSATGMDVIINKGFGFLKQM
ncbi:MAG: hypothetical protein EWM47_12430 [Anaerolineaceae bacterium]|nr:MAG: hypothetical protein EWM47_12430 [Anaerolineaceae bacterium]